MKGKRRLGYIAVAGLVVLGLAGGGSVLMASYLFQRSQSGVVQIMGSQLALFSDNGATIPLGAEVVLDFGEVRQDEPSDTVLLYLQNQGTDELMPTLSVADLDGALTLSDAVFGDVPASPGSIPLYVPIDWTWTPAGLGNSLSAAIDDVQTTIPLTLTDISSAPSWVNIGFEYIHYTGVSGTSLTGCTRGVGGSTAASAIAGAAANFGTLTETGALMAPGAVLEVALTLTADGATAFGSEAFTVEIEAVDGA